MISGTKKSPQKRGDFFILVVQMVDNPSSGDKRSDHALDHKETSQLLHDHPVKCECNSGAFSRINKRALRDRYQVEHGIALQAGLRLPYHQLEFSLPSPLKTPSCSPLTHGNLMGHLMSFHTTNCFFLFCTTRFAF